MVVCERGVCQIVYFHDSPVGLVVVVGGMGMGIGMDGLGGGIHPPSTPRRRGLHGFGLLSPPRPIVDWSCLSYNCPLCGVCVFRPSPCPVDPTTGPVAVSALFLL